MSDNDDGPTNDESTTDASSAGGQGQTGSGSSGTTGGQADAGGQGGTGGQRPAGGQGPERDPGSVGSDLEPHVAGALCYVLGWLSGLFFFFTEKEDEFVRFHAAQSIVVFGAFTAIYFVLGQVLWPTLFSAGGLGAFRLLNLINTLLVLAGLGLWLGLMYVAYQGRWYELPLAGDVANDLIADSDVTVERKSVGD